MLEEERTKPFRKMSPHLRVLLRGMLWLIIENKETSWGKRGLIFGACYLVVTVFILAFIGFNHTNWFVLAALFSQSYFCSQDW
jgi:hypothetical protein